MPVPSSTPDAVNSSLNKSMWTTSAGIFGSRITGLLRDIVMAGYWGGTGVMQAAFQVAFAIPNMLRSLFGEGAFTAAFVPMLSAKSATASPAEAWRLTERTISAQAVILGLFVILGSIASMVIHAFLPADIAAHVRVTFLILPLLMPYALLICMVGAFSSFLNCQRRFALPAVVPVIFNVVQIATILLVCIHWSITELTPLLIFCGSIILAGLLQLLAVIVACRRQGFIFHFRLDWRDPDINTLGRRIAPGLLGAGVAQVNNLIDKALAMILGPAAIGALNYSQHLVYLPTGIFGVAMSVVCLPSLSRAFARKDYDEMAGSLDFALRQMLFLTLPCAVFFGVLAEPLIRMLFFRGAFTDEAVRECAWALYFYLLGLPAFSCAKIAANAHHAQQDTTTPVKIALICVAVNLPLNIILMLFLRQGGLALSTSICSWLNVVLLLRLARRSLPAWEPMRTVQAGATLAALTGIAGVTAWGAARAIATIAWPGAFWTNAAMTIGGTAAGGLCYLALCLLCRRHELNTISAILHRRRRR
ncbi:murein biosynthesis integral membrane protein MurJ [Oligosphaera ethanolica]|uniref:Probable lipid II flippase MurJ n=1 Tax=Oligosphaera ethanolica TaxID=760260 RepID=A0AAE4AR78_9BACT|nr:murein biosynthesis integral membrane protein MurJ [Oligosphaera ethanolica]MDQ0291207.1 putative peptidoglycan lipid II flippase [Oligosphaera ethanolica]